MDRDTHTATTARRVSLNALSNIAATGLDMVIQIVLLRFILGVLTKEVYGIWAITGGVFAYSTLLQLGINSAVNYFIPPLLVKGDHDGLSRVVSTAVVFYMVVSAIVVVATGILLVYFPTWFNIGPAYAAKSRWLVAMVGGFFALSIPLTVFQGVLSGLQRYAPMNLARVICRVSRAALIVGLLYANYGLLGLGAAHVLARLAEAIAMPILAKRSLPGLRIRYALASMSTFKEMLGYSIYTLIWSLSYTIRDRAAIVVIGVLLTTSAATFYTVPIMMVQAVYAIIQAVAAVTKPAASALLAEGNLEKIKALVLRGNRLVGTLAFAIAAVLLIYGETIIVVWVNQEEFRRMGVVLTLLILGELLTLAQLVSAYVLIGMGRHRAFAWFTLAMGLASLVGMITLVTVCDAGLVGVAIGTAIPAVITGVMFVPAYTSKVLGCSLLHYCWTSLVRPAMAVAPFALVLGLYRWYHDPQTVGALVLAGLASAPMWLAGAYLIALEPSERQQARTLVARLCRPLVGRRS